MLKYVFVCKNMNFRGLIIRHKKTKKKHQVDFAKGYERKKIKLWNSEEALFVEKKTKLPTTSLSWCRSSRLAKLRSMTTAETSWTVTQIYTSLLSIYPIVSKDFQLLFLCIDGVLIEHDKAALSNYWYSGPRNELGLKFLLFELWWFRW